MRRSKVACALFCGPGLFLSVFAAAQAPEPRPCDAEPVATRCGQATGASPALAMVDGRPLTLDELDAKEREAIAGLEARIARGRRQALEDAIDDRLLEIEAGKRRETADALYYAEIIRKIAPATEEEIHAEYAAHPEMHGSSEEALRNWLSGNVWTKNRTRLFAEWAAAAREIHPVVYRADVNAPGLSAAAVLAVVGGKPITLASIAERLKADRDGAQQEAYQAEKAAVEKAVHARLVEAEAHRRGVSPDELLRVEVTDKVHPATDEEVAAFFGEHRAEMEGDLESSRTEIAEFLNAEARDEAERQFYAALSDGAGARITLPQPERIAVDVPTAGAPSRGPRSAPVTIVEFADFECPPCGRMYPQTEAVLKSYAGRVRLVFRHFPLPMHPYAFRAATASVAAGVQGKFWPYAGRLFGNQKALGDPSLRAYAAESGLSAGRFDRDLDSEAAAVRVVHDMRLGKAYGARWTPTLFVNGVMLRDGSLAEAVETALAGASRAKPAR